MGAGKGIVTWYKAITALLGWFALGLQLTILVQNTTAKGDGLAVAIVTYFSFFTILTNLLVAISFTAQAGWAHHAFGQFFSRPAVKAGLALYITIVGIIYSLLLRRLWQPTGWQKIADMLLHDLIPVLTIVCWLAFEPKGKLKWKHALWWMTYPAVYLAYSLIRGAIAHTYPYPFIDVAKLGWKQVLINASFLALAFLSLGLMYIAIDRLLGLRAFKKGRL